MIATVDDKRLIPLSSEHLWCERTSERQWHYCKYCYRDVPTFVLTEGRRGSLNPIQQLRCCWECGSGLEVIFSIRGGVA